MYNHPYIVAQDFKNTYVNAPGLAFVSIVSLRVPDVIAHFHVLQLRVRFSFLSFRHESLVTVREFYTECNAWFRWSERLIISSNSCGHIHLDKRLINNSFH
jgi:hypothetical protein